MDAVLLAERLVLAAVFTTAGTAKAVDLEGSRGAVEAFGLPTRWAAALGALLPAAELAVAASLVVAWPGRAGAAAALALLVAFAAGMTLNLVRGRAPSCHCFGRVHSKPANWRAVSLDLALAAAALTIVVAGAGTELSLAEELAAGGLILAGAGFLTVKAGRRRSLTTQLGLPLSTQAPDFRVCTLDGQTATLGSLRMGGAPLLLVFSAVDCGPCRTLAPEIAEWQRRYQDRLAIAVMECGVERSDLPDPHGRANVLVDEECGVGDLYRAQGTPTAVLIASDGTIASRVAAGPDAVEALVARHVQ